MALSGGQSREIRKTMSDRYICRIPSIGEMHRKWDYEIGQHPDDPNWNFEKVHDYCYERGFTIYPGKISTTDTFRLCSLGKIYPEDIEAFFTVFTEALDHFGIRHN